MISLSQIVTNFNVHAPGEKSLTYSSFNSYIINVDPKILYCPLAAYMGVIKQLVISPVFSFENM